jgi:hypothetical protein
MPPPISLPRRKLVFVELNELNFDLVRRYLGNHSLPSFRRLLDSFQAVETFSESRYEDLEPWIQWVSAHTGKTYGEHGVFRLGDGANSDFPQIFETLERQGLRVGAISPMNSRNALSKPAYFVPDPWTVTPCDGSGFSRRLTAMLRQTVNENAQDRIALSSKLTLIEAGVRTLGVGSQLALFNLIRRIPGRRWVRALFLDQLIHHIHLYLLKKTRPDASFVFFNAGAHIQHHYYFNSPHVQVPLRNPAWYVAPDVDPILEMLEFYDRILGDYVAMTQQGVNLIVATGLTQVPYDRVKFYYRLKDHADFMQRMGIVCREALPRMTRDFELLFDDAAACGAAAAKLASVHVVRDNQPLFGDIDNRGTSLFVTLTYASEILAGDSVMFDGGRLDGLHAQVAFVAIKNGMHSAKGFAFLSPGASTDAPSAPVHVASLFSLTLQACGKRPANTA